MGYTGPVEDLMFVFNELAGLDELSGLPGLSHVDAVTVEAILTENARFVSEVLAPLNHSGDIEGAHWHQCEVSTAAGFKEAFTAFTQAGWQGLPHPDRYGGQALPRLVATACIEMINAANLSFGLCPLLTDGAIEALLTAGSEAQKHMYIPPMIAGEWTGTMNLTEPQAGSDLGMIATKAIPQEDGTYRLFGQKIYITFGEHDMAKNIIHLVLARTPNAPVGVKGLSLFMAPKFLVHADGSLGQRNDVFCASIEHKLGIRASPTAVMVYGDGQGEVGPGAVAHRVGEENRGLEYMFVMMNAARFAVGVQGIGIAERSYQKALQYAHERIQSRSVDGSGAEPVLIVDHPDVKRMLMFMRAHIESSRAMACVAAAACDRARCHSDVLIRAQNLDFYEFMVPIIKGWCTEMSIEVVSTGLQIHGGMGFIEETGAAQYYRDARILTIYEGTTAIQANDLVMRKTVRNQGAVAKALAQRIESTECALLQSECPDAQGLHRHLRAARQAFTEVVDFMCTSIASNPRAVFAGSVAYLKLAGMTLCGWQMARALLAAKNHPHPCHDQLFYEHKIKTARFFGDHILSTAPGLRVAIVESL